MIQLLPPPIFAVDHSADTRLLITGADRAKLLNGFCTNDIKSLLPGQGREAFITNHQGKTIGHVVVQCHAEHLELRTVAGQAEKIIKHLDRFVITEDVAFRDATAESTQWLLAGSEAQGRLSALGLPLPTELLSFTSLEFAGITATCQLVPYLGLSYLVTIARDQAELCGAGLRSANIPIIEDRELLTGLRIEGNWPLFGSDITDDNLPQEIGRDKAAISFKKGCYLGQETVARLDALGHVNKILTRVSFHLPMPEALAAVGSDISLDGKSIGRFTSVGWSPRFESPIGFAMLRVAHAQAGTRLIFGSGELEVLPKSA